MIVITYSATAATNQSAQTQMDASPLRLRRGELSIVEPPEWNDFGRGERARVCKTKLRKGSGFHLSKSICGHYSNSTTVRIIVLSASSGSRELLTQSF